LSNVPFRWWRPALAFALDVAPPHGIDLLDQRDLDSCLVPAVRHLARHGRPLVSVSGTKRRGPTSFFGIGPAHGEEGRK
jgi:hypothetical protein